MVCLKLILVHSILLRITDQSPRQSLFNTNSEPLQPEKGKNVKIEHIGFVLAYMCMMVPHNKRTVNTVLK